MEVEALEGGFRLRMGARVLLEQSAASPAFFVGRGKADIAMNRGNFRVEDRLSERVALRGAAERGGRWELAAEPGGRALLAVWCEQGALWLEALEEGWNRFWLRVAADPAEHVWGAGEQLSYLNLRGRHFPLWTSEPGIGRDKHSAITFEADRLGGAGGDYWHTNYPQPTYLSQRRYALHIETTAYAAFDFRAPDFHEIEVWEVPREIALIEGDSLAGLVGRLSKRFGRPPRLPAWAYSGAILGLKDGANSFARMERVVEAGAVIAGLWCEDWAGVRETSFGTRLFWDWRANETRYPGLRQRIAELSNRGIRFLGYVNPYLAVDGALYPHALHAGFLALRPGGDGPYIVDFGEFDCGIVDFTNPEAARWFAEDVIGLNMLDYGLSGWMADFGEYLPHDVVLHDGTPGTLAHNAWPVIWAEVNAQAVASRGAMGDAVFFMRAGWTGVSRWCPLLWAGDQCVNFSRHDGIGTAIRAALSAGLVGNAYHHSDLGGYTSLFGLTRTPELLMRWAELAAFTPVMRTHEGNRPLQNLQVDGSGEVLDHFVRMTRIHAALAPYVAVLVDEAAEAGLPCMRPLFLHHEDDPAACEVETAYLYGRDLLVAPVIEAGARGARVYLPAGTEWVHLWSGDCLPGGAAVHVTAPLGRPPVFWRTDSAHRGVFESVAAL